MRLPLHAVDLSLSKGWTAGYLEGIMSAEQRSNTAKWHVFEAIDPKHSLFRILLLGVVSEMGIAMILDGNVRTQGYCITAWIEDEKCFMGTNS